MNADPITTCPRCKAPVRPARRGPQSAQTDEHGRGAGFSEAMQPATCPRCGWEDRPAPTP